MNSKHNQSIEPHEILIQDELKRIGVHLRTPAELTDAELPAELARAIDGLAKIHVYLDMTDHLSDRELYEAIHRDMAEETILILGNKPCITCLDYTNSGGDYDGESYLRYYADEKERALWAEDDFDLPEKCALPYDRDSTLPQPPIPGRG